MLDSSDKHTCSQAGQRHDRLPEDEGRSTGTGEPVETTLSQKMLSAVTGSVFTSLLVTPLDVVRVRLQSQASHGPPSTPSRSPSPGSAEFAKLPPNLGISTCCREVFWIQSQGQFCAAGTSAAGSVDGTLLAGAGCAVEETKKRTFNSTIDGLRKIARNEGISTLWRGLSPTLLMAVPGNVIYFAGYDWLRQSKLSPVRGRIADAYAPLVAGSMARVGAAIVVSPIEMLRTRMQASNSSGSSGIMRQTIAGLREMVSVNGYTSLWRGLGLTLWRDVPFSALYWWGYEYGREALSDARLASKDAAKPRDARARDHQLDHGTVLIDSFVAGAVSGAMAAFVTTPFDVGKTRQQVAQHASECIGGLDGVGGSMASSIRPEDGSMPRFLWHLFKTEGAAGLFRGWIPRTMKVAPACAIMISSYEIGKKMAGGMNERKDERKDERGNG